MNLRALGKYLENKTEDSLKEEITNLYKKFDSVKEYYDLQIRPIDLENIAQKYKVILLKQFCPPKGLPELKYSVARKAVSDFKKVCQDVRAIIDMQLTYVEYGANCAVEYGDIDEPFYNSMESMFSKTLHDMEMQDLLEAFQPRCHAIQIKTEHMGWGFADAINDLYEQYFKK